MNRAATLSLLALLAGCAGAPPDAPKSARAASSAAPAPTCEAPRLDAPPPTSFARPKSSLSAALGPPAHAVRDVLAVEGHAVSVQAKLAYGALSKDLEHEPVRLFVGTCRGWTAMADATSDERGWMRAALPPLAPGSYFLRVHVLGDASAGDGALHVLRPGARLAVFDVDGTLTTSDAELVRELSSQLASRRHVPEAYPGGAALTQAHARRGDHVVYLTGRPYWLTGVTRDWLAAGGFARGTLVTTDTGAEAVPTPAGVGDFKTRRLRGLREAGLVVAAAYGNASTDVLAYREGGVATDVTFIIGKHGGEGGTRAVSGSWEPRARVVAEGGER